MSIDNESTQYIDQLAHPDYVRLIGVLGLDNAGYHLVSISGAWQLNITWAAEQDSEDYIGQSVVVVGAPVRSIYCHKLNVAEIDFFDKQNEEKSAKTLS